MADSTTPEPAEEAPTEPVSAPEVPERYRVVYVTRDSKDWLAIDAPDGLVPPPTISLHQPLAGYLEFYYASCYNLPVPKEAGKPDERYRPRHSSES